MKNQETTIEKLMQIIGEQTVQIRLMNDEIQRLKINEKTDISDTPNVPVPAGVQPE